MIPIAEAILSGDTQVTLALVVSLLGTVAAYVGERVSTRYRLAALERSDEKQLEHMAALSDRHQKDRAECQTRMSTMERDLDRLKMTASTLSPHRSGSWPTTTGHDER